VLAAPRKQGVRVFVMTAETCELRTSESALENWLRTKAPIHPKAFDLVERQHKTGNLSNQFADLLAAAGLREKKNHKSAAKGRGSRRDVEPLSFHSLRRTATTMLHEAGVPAAVAQALIGHDSEAMRELYVSVGRDALTKGRCTRIPCTTT